MKFGFRPIIAIKFLFAILLLASLFTSASKNEINDLTQFQTQNSNFSLQQNSTEQINKEEEEENMANSIISEKHQGEPIIKEISKLILHKIFYQYLTIREMQLKVKVISKWFEQLLDPQNEMKGMWRRWSTLQLNLANRELLLNMNYESAPKFDPENIFCVSKNKFVIKTNDKKIFCMEDPQVDYAQLFLSEIRKKLSLEKKNDDLLFNAFKIHNFTDGWMTITKNGSVETGDNDLFLHKMPQNMQNVKTLCKLEKTMFALTEDGDVYSWGHENFVPEEDKLKQFKNIKNIFQIDEIFFARKDNGKLLYWVSEKDRDKLPNEWYSSLMDLQEICYWRTAAITVNNSVLSCQLADEENEELIYYPTIENVAITFGNRESLVAIQKDGQIHGWGENGDIPEDVKIILNGNVKFICSTDQAFAALTKDGHVYCWGDPTEGGKIPEGMHLENIETIVSNSDAFVAISKNGDLYCWGDPEEEEKIPETIKEKLKNVKMVATSQSSFCALTTSQDEDGREISSVYAWGGAEIPEHIQNQLIEVEIKMLFSTVSYFLVLLENGRVLGWDEYPTQSTFDITSSEKIVNIFPQSDATTFLFENGDVRSLQSLGRIPPCENYTIEDLDQEFMEIIFKDEEGGEMQGEDAMDVIFTDEEGGEMQGEDEEEMQGNKEEKLEDEEEFLDKK